MLLAILAVALHGCIGPFGPPDTFDDMWQRLNSLAVPTDFTLIAKEERGLASSPRRSPVSSIDTVSVGTKGRCASDCDNSWQMMEGGCCEELRQGV
jgi:hypothetical protein